MTTCKRCKERDACAGICARVEKLLPKELTGKDGHREISMDTDQLMAAAERRSYAEWDHMEAVSSREMPDLSALTHKERRALQLIMSGLTQREAAVRMKISRSSLRTRMDSARRKLYPAQTSHITEGD